MKIRIRYTILMSDVQKMLAESLSRHLNRDIRSEDIHPGEDDFVIDYVEEIPDTEAVQIMELTGRNTDEPPSDRLAEEMVECRLCGKEASATTAHLHQGKWIGVCCWDERLRTTE